MMEVFKRAIRVWNLGRSLEVDLTMVALQLVPRLCPPEIHNSDKRLQYAAPAYTDLLKHYDIQIRVAAQSKPEEYGFAERR